MLVLANILTEIVLVNLFWLGFFANTFFFLLFCLSCSLNLMATHLSLTHVTNHPDYFVTDGKVCFVCMLLCLPLHIVFRYIPLLFTLMVVLRATCVANCA